MPKGYYERTPEQRQRVSQHMLDVHRRWATEDPEGRRAVSHEGGVKATSLLWLCHDCGLIARGPSIGNHQKARGHEGRTCIGSIDTIGEPA